MLRNVNDNRLFPSEQEVTDCRSNNHSHTKPYVIRHEHQHKQKAQRHLHNMKKSLVNVHKGCHFWPESEEERIDLD